jgi:hypothetical protein
MKIDKETLALNLTGGLGNQLFQLAAAMACAGQGKLYIEKSIGLPRSQPDGTSDIEAFQLPNNVFFSTKREAPRLIKKILNVSLRLGISSSRNKNRYGSKPINLISSLGLSLYLGFWRNIVTPRGIGYAPLDLPNRSFLVGYFQSYKWPDIVYEDLMVMKLKRVQPEFQRYVELAKTEKPILVHVRLGDYVSIGTFGIPSKKYYENAINYILDNSQLKTIWLFSNEPEEALGLLPKNSRKQIRIIPDSGLTPAETLELMRHCHAYVIANSTFSWWGAYLSYNQKSLTVGPTPWFKGEASPKDIIPESWKTFQAFEEFM